MVQLNIISQNLSLALIIIISLGFMIFGILYSKKYFEVGGIFPSYFVHQRLVP